MLYYTITEFNIKKYTYRDPMIFKYLFGAETFINIHLQQVFDQTLSTYASDTCTYYKSCDMESVPDVYAHIQFIVPVMLSSTVDITIKLNITSK